MLLKNSFLLPRLFYNVEFEFSWFHNTEQSSEILILKMGLPHEIGQHLDKKLFLEKCYFLLFGSFY